MARGLDGPFEILLRDTADAVNLAVAGQVNDGLALLRAGLEWAQSRDVASGAADDLVASYHRALRHYCRQYGVPSVGSPAREECELSV